MKRRFLTFFLVFPVLAWAGTESMPSMPVLKPARVFRVSAGDRLVEQAGFGEREPEVRAMNEMMVEGPKRVGMDMSVHVASAEVKFKIEISGVPKSTVVGLQSLRFTVQEIASQRAAEHLNPVVQVAMANMDMGTEEPKVQELGGGAYKVQPYFSMVGPWTVKIRLPNGQEKVFDFQVHRNTTQK